jgi:hypothetical protein
MRTWKRAHSLVCRNLNLILIKLDKIGDFLIDYRYRIEMVENIEKGEKSFKRLTKFYTVSRRLKAVITAKNRAEIIADQKNDI